MRIELLTISYKALLIAGILLLIAFILVCVFLLSDWWKGVTMQKGNRRKWHLQDESLSEGVTASSEEEDTVNEAQGLEEEEEAVTPEEEADFKRLELLAHKIEDILTEKNINREKIVEKMAALIHTFSDLNKPAFRRAINNLIIRRAQQQCFITITETEVDRLWPSVGSNYIFKKGG